MKMLKHACRLTANISEKHLSNHQIIDPLIGHKLKGYYIAKMPSWALQHYLSINNPSKATYSFDVSNSLELSNAVDGAFIICGFVNPNCNSKSIQKQNSAHPHNPAYDIDSSNNSSIQILTVALYFPSRGTYYSPRFMSDTTHL